MVFGSDRTVKETEITDYPAFFEELRGSDSLPTTSQPSVGDFIACFEQLLAAGHDIVSIHISAGISGTATRHARRPSSLSVTARAASACG